MKRRRSTVEREIDGSTLTQEKMKPVLTERQALTKSLKEQTRLLGSEPCSYKKTVIRERIDLIRKALHDLEVAS